MKKIILYCLIVSLLLPIAAIAANKVVVVPLSTTNSPDKVLGVGRPGTSLRSHATLKGYCTNSAGTNFALSYNYAPWYGAAEVCPKGAWVCESSDIPTTGSCNIIQETTWRYYDCSGTEQAYGLQTALTGFVADALPNNNPAYAAIINSADLSARTFGIGCDLRPVWCCWK